MRWASHHASPAASSGAGDEQHRRAQQRRVDRPEGLGQRLLDDDAPVDARDLRHRRQHRLARDVAAGRRLARPVEDGAAQGLERPLRGLVGAQHQVDVGVGDKASRAVEHEGVRRCAPHGSPRSPPR